MFEFLQKKTNKRQQEMATLLGRPAPEYAEILLDMLETRSHIELAMILIGYINARSLATAVMQVDTSITIDKLIEGGTDVLSESDQIPITLQDIAARNRSYWLFYGLLLQRHFLNYVKTPIAFQSITAKMVLELLRGTEGLLEAIATAVWSKDETSLFDHVYWNNYSSLPDQKLFSLNVILADNNLKSLRQDEQLKRIIIDFEGNDRS